jgi:SAM-dependent methyltransferase
MGASLKSPKGRTRAGLLGRLKRLAANALLDLRFGGRFLGGLVRSRYKHLGARDCSNSDYAALALMWELFSLRPGDVVVDVGCGKGRVINFLLSRGVASTIYGIEIDPLIADATRRRLRRYRNVRILTGNALECLPPEGTVFYLFNPFYDYVLREFKDRLAALPNPEQIRIIYYNCVYLGVFSDDPAWTVEVRNPGEGRPGIFPAALITRRGMPG